MTRDEICAIYKLIRKRPLLLKTYSNSPLITGMQADAFQTELRNIGIVNRQWLSFNSATINSMLGNKMYLGIIKNGEIFLIYFPNYKLLIRKHLIWWREVRSRQGTEPKSIERKDALLADVPFCGHRLRTTSRRSNNRLSKNDPNNELVTIYVCENKLYEKGIVGVRPPESQST